MTRTDRAHANGAFAAGLLDGWTDAGTRPEFTMVMGVRTGALAARFAFLGSACERQLEEVFTSYATEDIGKRRRLSRP